MKIENFILMLLIAGYTVSAKDRRIRAVKDKKRLEIIDKYCDVSSWHIGQVDTFGNNGKWLTKPVLIETYTIV